MRLRFLCCGAVGVLTAVGLVALAAPVAMAAAGADWRPEKPVEIVVPTAAGGENDRVARLMQKIFRDRKLVTTPVLIINQAGGNQVLAVVRLTQNARDPHFLLYGTSTLFTNEMAGLTKIHYRDLTPIALVMTDSMALTVSAESPMKNMRDLIDRLKVDVKSLSFGTVARGGVNHLALSQAMRSAGIDPKALKLVIFKTNGETLTAIMGGHIQVMVSSVSAAFDRFQEGSMRILGIASPKRLTGSLAGVPTLAESGIEATGAANWRCIFAPKGITAAQRTFWENAVAVVNDSDEWTKDIEGRSQTQIFLRGQELESYLDKTYKATRDAMMDIGIVK